jgi:hypothetical protein
MKKLILILGAILCIGCSKECEEERNAIEQAYRDQLDRDDLSQEQRDQFEKERDKRLAEFDC